MTDAKQTYCSEIAREHDLPLHGTATQGQVWLLLEYPPAWDAKAFDGAYIPDEVKAHLQSAVEGVRILMIRKKVKGGRKGLRFFIGITDTHDPKLYEYQIREYTDLLEIDLSFLAAGEPGDPADLREKPLYLVCTNGKRDLCCSRFGTKLFKAMKEVDSESVWQSSHIGGHNKAPVTLFFPHGLNYGRTTPKDMRLLMKEYQQGRVGLDFYRGRVGFEPPIQAAETFWRQETGIMDLPGMEVTSVEALGEDEWLIGIQGVDGANQISFHIRRQVSEVEIPMTCTGKKVENVSQFRLV